MDNTKKLVLIALLVTSFGVGWLLNSMNLFPNMDWLWVLGLAIAGLLMFFVGGLSKVTVVGGPFLLAASFLTFFQQSGRLSWQLELPWLVIVFGVLLLIAAFLPLPIPEWLKTDITEIGGSAPGTGGGRDEGPDADG